MRIYEIWDQSALVTSLSARNARSALRKVEKKVGMKIDNARVIDITTDEKLPSCGACGWTGEANEYSVSRCPNCNCPV